MPEERKNNIKFSKFKPIRERNILNPVFESYYRIVGVDRYDDFDIQLRPLDGGGDCTISYELLSTKLNFIKPRVRNGGFLAWNLKISYRYKGNQEIYSAYLSIVQKGEANNLWHVYGSGDTLICLDWLVCILDNFSDDSRFSFSADIDKIKLSATIISDINGNSINTTTDEDTRILLGQFKDQFKAHDDKCLITLSKYAKNNGKNLIKNGKHDAGIIYLDDALNISLYKHSEYIELYRNRDHKSKWLPSRKQFYDTFIHNTYVREGKKKNYDYSVAIAAIAAINQQAILAKEGVIFAKKYFMDGSWPHIFELMTLIARNLIYFSRFEDFSFCKNFIYKKLQPALEIFKKNDYISTNLGALYEERFLKEISYAFLNKLYKDNDQDVQSCFAQIALFPELKNKGTLTFLNKSFGSRYNAIESGALSGAKLNKTIDEAMAIKSKYSDIAQEIKSSEEAQRAKIYVSYLSTKLSKNKADFEKSYAKLEGDTYDLAIANPSPKTLKLYNSVKDKKYLRLAEFVQSFDEKVEEYKIAKKHYTVNGGDVPNGKYYYEAEFFENFFKILRIIKKQNLSRAVKEAGRFVKRKNLEIPRLLPRIIYFYHILKLISLLPISEKEAGSAVSIIREYDGGKISGMHNLDRWKEIAIAYCKTLEHTNLDYAVITNIPIILQEIDSESSLIQNLADQIPLVMKEHVDPGHIEALMEPGEEERENNIQKYGKTINYCRDFIHYIDPYFKVPLLRLLKDFINPSIKEIKILTSTPYIGIKKSDTNKIGYLLALQDNLPEEIKVFKNIGVSLEIRVHNGNKFHPRQVESANNFKALIPSYDHIIKGKYDKILPGQGDFAPFEKLWKEAIDIKDWKY